MQATEYQPSAPCRPRSPLFERAIPVTSVTSSNASPLSSLELESFMLNVDASLRVHARHQFFVWAQGLLQNLVRHELLICALRNGESLSFHVDSFATSPAEPAAFSDTFRQDTSLVPHLIKIWEDNHFRPVACEVGEGSPFAQSKLARELSRIGTHGVLAHGIYDVFGRLASLFTFASQSKVIDPRQVYFAELIVPFLHQAWVRTQINRPLEGGGTSSARVDLLTSREQEILKWIHSGKSNIEIGTILGISPLTVKNHVQKILRKLNVQNRAQAVGKGLALRILNI